jgi:hypothetical protein
MFIYGNTKKVEQIIRLFEYSMQDCCSQKT